MASNVPSVFVSSTCYDLRQIRADLRDFFESLGLQTVLSEYNSFPVDPHINAVENCLKAVDEGAEIFVLLVGGRYGSTNDQGKSVTNMEYLRARAKGIPVYAFVHQSILHILPVWKSNPDGDFQNVVDSPRLFEFVTYLRESSGVWVFPFELAQEIIDTLRKQLAYLFMDGLQLIKRVASASLPPSLAELQGSPLRLVIEKPDHWEYRLFSEVLIQEIDRCKQLKMDLNYEIAFGKADQLDRQSVFGWLSTKSSELAKLLGAARPIIDNALQEAIGAPGTEGDPESIVYAAKKLGALYRECLEWAIDFHRVRADEDFETIVRMTSKLTSEMFKGIEEFSETFKTTFDDLIANPPKQGEERTLNLTLKLDVPDMPEIYAELVRLREKYDLVDE